MLVPQAAYAVGMYIMMAQLGLLGSAVGLAAAQLAICFPYVFVLVQAQLTRLSPDLDLVAMTMGASRAARMDWHKFKAASSDRGLRSAAGVSY